MCNKQTVKAVCSIDDSNKFLFHVIVDLLKFNHYFFSLPADESENSGNLYRNVDRYLNLQNSAYDINSLISKVCNFLTFKLLSIFYY